jgi:hypothetical protein
MQTSLPRKRQFAPLGDNVNRVALLVRGEAQSVEDSPVATDAQYLGAATPFPSEIETIPGQTSDDRALRILGGMAARRCPLVGE